MIRKTHRLYGQSINIKFFIKYFNFNEFYTYRADSTPPSLLMSEFSCGSPKKLANLLDSQIAASRSELIRLEEIKKLQVHNFYYYYYKY